ncbi:MAG: nitroreductase family protein [Bulleidia sp.]
MEFQKVLNRRRSVRQFTQEAVSEADIDILLHAAMSGPSACNFQPWEFYVVTNPTILEQLKQATPYSGISAPLAITVCGKKTENAPETASAYWIQDCSAATENILLSAVDQGLGAVWCGVWPQSEPVNNVRRLLGISESLFPLNIIYIGHPVHTMDGNSHYREDHIHRID